MKRFISTILVLYFVYQCDCENSTYTTMYDGVDLDEILSSDRLLAGYVNCLLDKGPCTPDGKELKRNLPDAIENDCSKCTEKQRDGADKVMHYIIDHKPEDWKKLEAKYDSEGTYKLKYMSSQQKVEPESKENKNDKGYEDDDDDDDDVLYNKGPTPRMDSNE
ncbi:ejaculatory bulb-specific protein 3-like [Vanessa atalanta]|uniref:ejaculatory bulb-specific protein 3-like n=1 Tax=Vanessa atalanta TaxID=42275 RepID=UPI001FCD6709|nr:ejaculatory bulb-specific protein 3-like [Vanessa atalanta]